MISLSKYLQYCFYSVFCCLYLFVTLSYALPEVKNISKEEYHLTISENIRNAKNSILIVLPFLSCNTDNADDPVLKNIKDILLASMEGIKVRLVVNPVGIFSTVAPEIKNKDKVFSLLEESKSIELIKNNKFEINYSLIIIDDNIIIESTQPWISDIDLSNKSYNNTLIISDSLAKEKKENINSLLNFIQKNSSGQYQDTGAFIKFKDIDFNNSLIREIFKSKKEIISDIYLYFLTRRSVSGRESFKISLKEICQVLYPENDKKSTIKLIRKNIKKLSASKLLKYEKIDFYNYKITVIKSDKKEKCFRFPASYFKYKYHRTLSFEQKYVYVILLYLSYETGRFPFVEVNEDFKKTFTMIKPEKVPGILSYFEKNLLISVNPFSVNNEDYGKNFLNYFLLPLRNVSDIKRAINILQEKYGIKNVQKAQILLSQLNKEQDPSAINDILYYINELGLLETQKVLHIVSNLPANHPSRSFTEVKKQLVKKLNGKFNGENQ